MQKKKSKVMVYMTDFRSVAILTFYLSFEDIEN